ncbi:MAG: hypothetical protein ACRD2A_25485 [Vicinamibacterales bacterium]
MTCLLATSSAVASPPYARSGLERRCSDIGDVYSSRLVSVTHTCQLEGYADEETGFIALDLESRSQGVALDLARRSEDVVVVLPAAGADRLIGWFETTIPTPAPNPRTVEVDLALRWARITLQNYKADFTDIRARLRVLVFADCDPGCVGVGETMLLDDAGSIGSETRSVSVPLGLSEPVPAGTPVTVFVNVIAEVSYGAASAGWAIVRMRGMMSDIRVVP